MLFPFVMICDVWQDAHKIVKSVWLSVWSMYMWCIRQFNVLTPLTELPSPEETFAATAKTRFLAMPPSSDNIDPLCYRRKERAEVLSTPDHPLETVWHTRCMYVNTPRGNVMMRYDAYKEGFAYYCDQTYVPYSILNALAMRYVTLYRCADFFMDETVLSAHDIRNPLLQAIQDEDKKTEAEKRQHRPKFLGEHNDVFLKRKSNEEAPKAHKEEAPTQQKRKDPRTNLFLYRGKLHNMRMLGPSAPPTPAVRQQFATSIFKDLFDANIPITYKDYKCNL